MTTVQQFYKGETVSLTIEIKSKSTNILADPTLAAITIVKNKMASGAEVKKVDGINMTKVSTGKYAYRWVSDEVGTYSVTYVVNNDGNITIAKDTFTVIN
jgi:hypothetical protein